MSLAHVCKNTNFLALYTGNTVITTTTTTTTYTITTTTTTTTTPHSYDECYSY